MEGHGKRSYNWYKHHAWAALALLSIFFAFTRFYPNVPSHITLVVVGCLCIYALAAILLTYRHNRENVLRERESVPDTPDIDSKLEKEKHKVEKKMLKADTKRAKKEQSK